MLTEQQLKWLKRVEELFLRYGIKSVTMDDVARELGISKKTLYQFVENKNDLVLKVVEHHILDEEEQNRCVSVQAGNAIDEILMTLQYTMADLQRMKTNVLFDMQKYHREAWERIMAYQRESLSKIVRENLDRGIREGLYRNDFDPDLVTRLHVSQSFLLFDDSWFPRPHYSLENVFREYMLFYLHGVVSDKGRHLLKEKLS